MPKKLSVLEWKARYLMGVPDVDTAGNAFPIEDYQYHLNLGYETLSTLLNMPIAKETIVEETHDYYADDYQHWAWIHLFRYPTIEVTRVAGSFPGGTTEVEFPTAWVALDKSAGHLQLVPTAGTVAQFIIGSTSLFLPLIQRGGYIPHFWKINYTAGFEEAAIPIDINDAVAKLACMSVANVLGDLIGGFGVLGASIGLDGLSQFLSLSKTATTNAMYSRILQYRTELFGRGDGGPGSQIHNLKRKYVGIRTVVL